MHTDAGPNVPCLVYARATETPVDGPPEKVFAFACDRRNQIQLIFCPVAISSIYFSTLFLYFPLLFSCFPPLVSPVRSATSKANSPNKEPWKIIQLFLSLFWDFPSQLLLGLCVHHGLPTVAEGRSYRRLQFHRQSFPRWHAENVDGPQANAKLEQPPPAASHDAPSRKSSGLRSTCVRGNVDVTRDPRRQLASHFLEPSPVLHFCHRQLSQAGPASNGPAIASPKCCFSSQSRADRTDRTG